MKNYSNLFGLTKPERTTEKSARNIEIEQNRPPPSESYQRGGERRWMNPVLIAWLIRCRNVANSRRKRGELDEHA